MVLESIPLPEGEGKGVLTVYVRFHCTYSICHCPLHDIDVFVPSGIIKPRVSGRGHCDLGPALPRPRSHWWAADTRGPGGDRRPQLGVPALDPHGEDHHHEHVVLRTL